MTVLSVLVVAHALLDKRDERRIIDIAPPHPKARSSFDGVRLLTIICGPTFWLRAFFLLPKACRELALESGRAPDMGRNPWTAVQRHTRSKPPFVC